MLRHVARDFQTMEESTDTKVRVLTQLEHVLTRSDMYIGSSHNEDITFLKWEGTEKGSVSASRACVQCPPAFLHLMNEVLVNTTDNAARCAAQTKIKVAIDKATGEIEIFNDGSTVPIEKYEGGDEWTPTLTFSHFFSGSNFDDSSKRKWGGRFGIGVKAVNAWSKKFSVVCCDASSGKKFEQTWHDNLSHSDPARVTKHTGKRSSTTVKFLPDYKRLNMNIEQGMEDNVFEALCSKVYDVCVCTRSGVGVWLNEKKLSVNSLQSYAVSLGGEGPFAQDAVTSEDGSVTFRVCLAQRGLDSDPDVVAFVNGIRCCSGTHVEMVWRQVSHIVNTMKSKNRREGGDVSIKPQHIKSESILVINTSICNPEFESQTKQTLTTPCKNFDFIWHPSSAFSNNLSKIAERAIRNAKGTEQKALEKGTKVSKGPVIVDKLDDAIFAGKNGEDCTLLVTEGDSAKAFAIAGLSAVGRERYGVYALRGKPMNVRNFTDRKVAENEQCAALMKILGLQWNANITIDNICNLRYKRVVILSDQDVDGSHICGLMINFFHSQWPSLMETNPDFLLRFATPLIRVTLPGSEGILSFYSEVEHDAWMRQRKEMSLTCGTPKYYKGLGTSNSMLARQYFRDWDSHVIRLQKTEHCEDALDLFFSQGPKAADMRKNFLLNEYDSSACVDYSKEATTWYDFLRRDMSHYSFADNIRSIPSVVDGMKVGQRKVMFSFFERKTSSEIKVAQAQSFAAEMSAYHHGEQSLGETIVGLAQDHVGTNNIAMLYPEGQFGTRLFKPSIHAAFRYIFTKLDPIARFVIPAADDTILDYHYDEGKRVEPCAYVPIVPMVLVNGAHGIGSGFSTHVPCFNPLDVMDATKAWIDAKAGEKEFVLQELVPWYRGFTGDVALQGDQVCTKGTFHVETTGKHPAIHVTELPVGKWTEDYKQMVKDTLLLKSDDKTSTDRFLTSITDLSTEHTVKIVLGTTASLLENVADLEVALKLRSREGMTNMHLFDCNGHLKKYTIAEIVEEHSSFRYEAYQKRLRWQIAESEKQHTVAANKSKFINLVRSNSIRLVEYEDNADLSQALAAHDLPSLPEGKYMTKMPLDSLTTENEKYFSREAALAAERLNKLQACDVLDAWRHDLDELRDAYLEYSHRKDLAAKEDADAQDCAKKRKGGGSGGKAVKKPRKTV